MWRHSKKAASQEPSDYVTHIGMLTSQTVVSHIVMLHIFFLLFPQPYIPTPIVSICEGGSGAVGGSPDSWHLGLCVYYAEELSASFLEYQ